MFGVRVIARFNGLQYLNNWSSLSRFCTNRNNLKYNKNTINSSDDCYVDNPKDRKNHILTINPNDEIDPEVLKGRSSHEEWKDTFGSLTGYCYRESLDEISDKCRDGEIEPHVRLDKKFRKHKPNWYGKKIEKLGKAGKVYEAVQVLEKEMLIDDRVMPTTYVFTTLIGILGRVGHTKKAFKLFNMMKKYGIAPDSPTYTALFNSCSNAYDKKDGLDRAIRLRELMKEKDVSVNIITYQAMIKAFAHLGDTKMAFRIADEAIEAGEKFSKETYSFLLMAAMADKEAGFSLGIKMWRLMRSKRIEINEYHYNLLLRCARDCGAGNGSVFNEILCSGSAKREEDLKLCSGKQMKMLEGPQTVSQDNHLALSDTSGSVLPENFKSLNFPNVLNPEFNLSLHPNWEISLPKDSSERLLLLGGVENVLKHMIKDKCKPTIKTFSLFMELIAQDETAEMDLLKLMEEHKVKPDIVLFNSLIKRRCLRKDYKGAKDVLNLIVEHKLKPDEKTFGCLAMGCSTENRGMSLLNDMMRANMLPNAEICDNLIFLSRMDFKYKLKILKFMKENDIKPSMKILQKLERHVKYAKDRILQGELGHAANVHKSQDFLHWFEIFLMNYKQWLRSMEFEPDVDPSIRFDQPTPVPDDDDDDPQRLTD